MRRRSVNLSTVLSDFGAVIKRLLVGAIVLSAFAFPLSANALTPLQTVTFFEQANALDSVSTYETANSPSALTLFSSLSPSFSDSGHRFLNWNTSANGTGITYSDGSMYSFAGDLSLYAQWVPLPVVHSVTFFENNSSSDVVSQFQSSASNLKLTTFSDLNPKFVNLGHTFVGWSNSPVGGSISFVDGATYGFGADVSLYAQWTADIYAVILTPNSGDMTQAEVSYTYGSPGLTLPTPTTSGSIFKGWFTAAIGGTLVGLGGSAFVPIGSMTLFGQWSTDGIVVTFNPDGGTMSPVIMNYSVGAPALLLPTPVRVDWVFNGWFTSAIGGTLIGLVGAPLIPAVAATLFAQWTPVLKETLKFDANGGSGVVASMTVPHGSMITLPGQTGILHAGFKLVHWNSTAQGTGTSYSAGQTMALMSSVTLYAQWSGHAPASLVGAVGSFAKTSAALSNGLKGQVRRLASIIKSRKYHVVNLYGYTAWTGLVSLNFSLSRKRATVVANYLRTQLRVLKVTGVTIRSAGEGSIGGATNPSYSRVEVFVL